ncbi:MAG: YitT family protein [Chitinophagaceae bacterium]|nr:MAG: YitT family protein [Chitinophagaceae bacterium]
MTVSEKVNWNDIFSFKSIAFTVLGVLCALVALKGFMIPNNFLDGGVTGISILVYKIFGINIGIVLFVLNLPFLFMGYKKMGKTFAVQGLIAITLLCILLEVVEVPTVTNEKILISIFGGFLIGLGIGFIIKIGGVIDGLEVIAEYTNKKSGFQTTEVIMLVNSIIFLTAAFYFGIEPAMYSILTYFTATKTADYVVDGFESYTALTIISKEHDAIKSIIVKDFKKAITVYKGERGYLYNSFDTKHDCDIIVTVVTRLEIHRIKQAILAKDPKAFFYVENIKEVGGGVVKQTKKH